MRVQDTAIATGIPTIDLLIVILCYNVPELTSDCLRSLVPELNQESDIRIALCENGSGHESEAYLRNTIAELGLEDNIYFEALTQNRGFAGGNNYILDKAMQHTTPRYVLFLNADTIVKPGCLKYCLDYLDNHPDVGAFSCKLVNPDGSVQNTARKFPTPLRSFACLWGMPWRIPRLFRWADPEDPTWDRETTSRDVDWLGGTALWIRGDLLRRFGALDEDFVFYGEDIEICHRVWVNGYRCRYDPGAAIVHLCGKSNDDLRWPARVRSLFTWRSRYLVQRKCYGRIAAWWLRASDLSMWSLRLVWLLVSQGTRSPKFCEARDVTKLLLTNRLTTPS